jgi:hypothetical protein
MFLLWIVLELVVDIGTWYGGAALGLGLSAGRLIGLAFSSDGQALLR